MKKSFLMLSLMALVSLGVFGWGCTKKTVFEPPLNQAQDSQNTVKTGETVAVEPVPLAFLLLTKDADVVVSRGDQQTKGMHELELYAGDEVEVVSGEARLMYPDTGMSVLLPGSKVQLIPKGDPPATPDPSSGRRGPGLGLDIWLEAGNIWTRLERILGTGENFSVTGSNVVATVRGTAFGMKLKDGKVDVEVAHSQVKVITNVTLNVGRVISNSVTLSAGSGIELDPNQLDKTADIKSIMQKSVRTLSPQEKSDLGYRFGTMKLDPGLLIKPQLPIRWSAPIILDNLRDITASTLNRWQSYAQWITQNQSILRSTETQLRANPLPIRFVAPLNEAILQDYIPTSTPRVKGPSA